MASTATAATCVSSEVGPRTRDTASAASAVFRAARDAEREVSGPSAALRARVAASKRAGEGAGADDDEEEEAAAAVAAAEEEVQEERHA